MNDFYQTLGLQETASQDEIKKAYRNLAMKHHPDRGGDQNTFKEINAAYDTLGDPKKREEYNAIKNGKHKFNFNSTDFNFDDIFAQTFHFNNGPGNVFNDIFSQRIQKNKDLNIRCQISLLDSFTGKQLDVNFTLPNSKTAKNIVINIPAGINNGETIRYNGLGDDSYPNLPRGNLNVTVFITPDPVFVRERDDLYTTLELNPFEAILGCKKTIKNILGKELDITISPGVKHDAQYKINGHGFTNMRTRKIGKMIAIIKIITPIITDKNILSEIKRINEQLNNIS